MTTSSAIGLAGIVQALVVMLMLPLPSFAGDSRCPIDWSKFNLTPQQEQQIAVLDSQWERSYKQVKPELMTDQARLSELLADAKSDPLEVVTLQQSIARKKEQLRSLSTSIYLRKRQILNQDQQRQLEERIHQLMEERRRQSAGGGDEATPDGVNGLLQRVRNMWTKPGVP